MIKLSPSAAGNNGFTKQGTGTLILNAANDYQGDTTIADNGGKIVIKNNTALGKAGTGTVDVKGGTHEIDGNLTVAEKSRKRQSSMAVLCSWLQPLTPHSTPA